MEKKLGFKNFFENKIVYNMNEFNEKKYDLIVRYNNKDYLVSSDIENIKNVLFGEIDNRYELFKYIELFMVPNTGLEHEKSVGMLRVAEEVFNSIGSKYPTHGYLCDMKDLKKDVCAIFMGVYLYGDTLEGPELGKFLKSIKTLKEEKARVILLHEAWRLIKGALFLGNITNEINRESIGWIRKNYQDIYFKKYINIVFSRWSNTMNMIDLEELKYRYIKYDGEDVFNSIFAREIEIAKILKKYFIEIFNIKSGFIIRENFSFFLEEHKDIFDAKTVELINEMKALFYCEYEVGVDKLNILASYFACCNKMLFQSIAEYKVDLTDIRFLGGIKTPYSDTVISGILIRYKIDLNK